MNEYEVERIIDIPRNNSYWDGTQWIPIRTPAGNGFWLRMDQDIAVVRKVDNKHRSEQIGLELMTT
jgi:hypothetical protein